MFYQGWCAWDRWRARLVLPCPILMKNWGMTFELDPKGDKIARPAFGLYFLSVCPLQLSAPQWDIDESCDESCVSANDQVAWATRSPKKIWSLWHVSPAHAPDMHEDEDEGDQPLVQPASRKERAEERRDLAVDGGDFVPLVPPRLPPAAPVRKRRRTSRMAGSNRFCATKGVKGLARANRGYLDFWAERQKVKPYATS